LFSNSRYINEYLQRSYYPPPTLPTIESRYPLYNTYQTTERKLEQLKQQGITVQPVILQSRKKKIFEKFK
jgi:hypothetical protein